MAPRRYDGSVVSQSTDSTLTVSTTVTVTRTTVRWIEPSSTLVKRIAQQSSGAEANHAPPDSENHPVQPTAESANRLSSPTLPPTSVSPTTTSESTVSAHFSTGPTYPVTLFDHRAAAPTHAPLGPRSNLTLYRPLGTMSGGEFALPDMPLSVQCLMWVLLGAGAVWSILVWLINSPPAPAQLHRKREKERATWWERLWGRQQGQPTKPIDKASKYAALPSTSSAGSAEGEGATTSATPERALDSPARLRKPPSAGETPRSPSLPPWMTARRTLSQGGGGAPEKHRHQHQRSPSGEVTGTSPANPLLPPPDTLNSRSSAEYLSAHHAFFSSARPPPERPTSPYISPRSSRSPSPSPSEYSLDALEAQQDVPPERSRSVRSVLGFASGMEKTGGKIWTGEWIEAVEGGVNRAVEKVVRWTEDGDGEEGLLLPVGRGA